MILWFSLAACLIASLYMPVLGQQVLKRRVIFIDLALAQVAAVGYAIGLAADGSGILYATIVTAVVIFMIASIPDNTNLPKEGIMGALYALALSLGMMILASLPHAEGQMMELMFGSMLGVNENELMILACSGLIAVILMRQHHMDTYIGRILFYSSLAIAVVPAIYTIGVVLVFALLVMPGLAVWNIHTGKTSLAILAASLASACGVLFSNYFDYPPSSSVIVFLSIIALISRLFIYLKTRKSQTLI